MNSRETLTHLGIPEKYHARVIEWAGGRSTAPLVGEHPPSCDMDYAHCDGDPCAHRIPDDYHDCGDLACANGAPCGDTGG